MQWHSARPLPVVRAPERRPGALLDEAKQPARLPAPLLSSPVKLHAL